MQNKHPHLQTKRVEEREKRKKRKEEEEGRGGKEREETGKDVEAPNLRRSLVLCALSGSCSSKATVFLNPLLRNAHFGDAGATTGDPSKDR